MRGRETASTMPETAEANHFGNECLEFLNYKQAFENVNYVQNYAQRDVLKCSVVLFHY